MKTKVKYRRMKRAVVYVNGGTVEGVSEVPPGFEVEVRDYDTDGTDQNLKRDEDGDVYLPLIFGGVMKRARSRRGLARRARIRAAAPQLLAACKKLHDALSEFLEFPDERDVDRKAALRAINASFAALAKAEPEAFGGERKQSTITKGDAR